MQGKNPYVSFAELGAVFALNTQNTIRKMKRRESIVTAWRVQITIWTFVLGFALAVYFLAHLIHESSHALACIVFNLPSIFYFDHVVPLIAPTDIAAIATGLAGGLGEALSALLRFLANYLFD